MAASPVAGDSTEALLCEANTIWLERQRIARALRKRAVRLEDRSADMGRRAVNEMVAAELRAAAHDVEVGQHRDEFV